MKKALFLGGLLAVAGLAVAAGASAGVTFLDGTAAQAYVARLAEKTAATRQRIVETRSEHAATGTVWYVSAAGADANDGRSPETAIASCARLAKLPLQAGDVVLFRRGDLFRGHFNAAKGVTYSAFGTGAKPVLCGSRKNFARADLWKETEIPHVWTCVEPLSNVGLITFDHDPGDPKEVGRFDVPTAQLVHSRKGVDAPRQLTKDLEFWSDLPKNALYLYSDRGNPGVRFRQIEIAEAVNGIGGADDVILDNLHVTLVGRHGVGSGTVRNLEVRNCIFDWLGGSLLIPEGKKGGPCRFGNAVEVYGGCDGYRVHDCWIYQIYDTGITHQCHHAKNERIFQKNVEYTRNLIEYCFWSIEYYNASNGYGETENVYVHDNHCRMGGYGWGCRGRAGGAPMFSIDDRPDKTVNYVNEGNILECCTGVLVNNFGRHAAPPDFIFRRNVYIQPRGWKFAHIGDREPPNSPFDTSAADVIRETFGETDGTFVFLPEPLK